LLKIFLVFWWFFGLFWFHKPWNPKTLLDHNHM
jgi:hypothetical protein